VIDHIVYAVPRRLRQAVGWFAGLTGAQPVRGGSNEGMGTANFIIGLGTGAYLGIIGPDLDQPQPVGGRWFGIDRLTAPSSSPGPSAADITARWRQREPWATTLASQQPCFGGPTLETTCSGGSRHRKSNSTTDWCRS
jgi:Glyoxalase-like domain